MQNSPEYNSNMHLEYILSKLPAKCRSIQLCTPCCAVYSSASTVFVHIHLPQRGHKNVDAHIKRDWGHRSNELCCCLRMVAGYPIGEGPDKRERAHTHTHTDTQVPLQQCTYRRHVGTDEGRQHAASTQTGPDRMVRCQQQQGRDCARVCVRQRACVHPRARVCVCACVRATALPASRRPAAS